MAVYSPKWQLGVSFKLHTRLRSPARIFYLPVQAKMMIPVNLGRCLSGGARITPTLIFLSGFSDRWIRERRGNEVRSGWLCVIPVAVSKHRGSAVNSNGNIGVTWFYAMWGAEQWLPMSSSITRYELSISPLRLFYVEQRNNSKMIHYMLLTSFGM